MVKIGIIGCGQWGRNHLRVFHELPNVEVKACSDLVQNNLENIKKTYKTVETTNDYKKILEDKEIDAVVVATPSTTHYTVAKDCLLHDKNVLVEKPIAMSSDECKELIELSKKMEKILMVGHTFEYNWSVIKLNELLTEKKIGDVYYLHSSRTNLGPIRGDVNVLWDLAPHDISIFLYLLKSDPIRVEAVGEDYIQDGVEDVVFLTLHFPNNIIGHVHVSWLAPYKVRTVTVVGTKGMIVFDDVNKDEPVKIFERGVEKINTDKQYSTFGEFQLLVRNGDVTIPKIPFSEPLKNECAHFIECIEKNENPRSDGYSGLRVVKVLEAAQKSLKNSGKSTEV